MLKNYLNCAVLGSVGRHFEFSGLMVLSDVNFPVSVLENCSWKILFQGLTEFKDVTKA